MEPVIEIKRGNKRENATVWQFVYKGNTYGSLVMGECSDELIKKEALEHYKYLTEKHGGK